VRRTSLILKNQGNPSQKREGLLQVKIHLISINLYDIDYYIKF